MPDLMDMDVHQAMEVCKEMKAVYGKLKTLDDLGLGYLTLDEASPSLSGGEAQRLKLASEMGKAQDDTVFILMNPPLDCIHWMLEC